MAWNDALQQLAALAGPGPDPRRVQHGLRNVLAREHARAAAGELADGTRTRLSRARAVDAAIFYLAQRGEEDPAFRDLVGFGRPLPLWADWAPMNDQERAQFIHDVEARISAILAAVEGAADRLAAEERVGSTYYSPFEPEAEPTPPPPDDD